MNEAVRIADLISTQEKEIAELRLSQGMLVSQAVAGQLWLEHPNPKAQLDLREYLRHACRLGESSVSELYTFGGIVIPFCEANRISLKTAASPENWPKLREALAALRRAIKAADRGAVKSILSDVRAAPSRLWIRNKYRNQRSAIGHGFTVVPGNGDVILIAQMNEGVTRETLLGRLGNLLNLSDPPKGYYIALPGVEARG